MTPVESINDEQLLQLCLELQYHRDFDMEGLSGELIVLYCMNDFVKKNGTEEFTDEDIRELVGELVSDYEISSLVSRGYLEPSFDDDGVKYTPTELFKKETQDENAQGS